MMQLIEPAPTGVIAGHDVQRGCLSPHLRILAMMVLTLTALLWAVPGHAQMPAAPAPAVAVEEPVVDPAALERIIRTLEDEPARQRLVEELRALQIAQQAGEEPPRVGLAGRVLEALSEQVDGLGRSLSIAARGFAGLPDFARRTVARLADPPERRAFFSQIGAVLAALLSGIVAYAVTVSVLSRPRGSVESRRPQPPLARLALLSLRLGFDLLAAGAFLLAAMAVMSVIDPPRTTRVLGLGLINATGLTLAITALSSFLLAPSAPNLRLLWLQDETAYYLHLWVRRLTVLAAYGLLMTDAAWMVGAPTAAHETLVRLIGLLLGLMLTVLVLQNRREVAGQLSRRLGQGGRRALIGNVLYRIADVWHVLAITVIIAAMFVMWFVNPADGGRGDRHGRSALAVVVLDRCAAGRACGRPGGAARAFRVAPERHAARFPGFEQRANRYVSLIRWTLSIIIWGLAAHRAFWRFGASIPSDGSPPAPAPRWWDRSSRLRWSSPLPRRCGSSPARAITRYLESQDTNGASPWSVRPASGRCCRCSATPFWCSSSASSDSPSWPSSGSISGRCWPAPASSAWPSDSAARRWCAISSPGYSS
jgi:moderate conductance mechanosensitive channel